MNLLRQSTAQTIRFGPFIDSTDFVTAETGLTIAQADRQISKDGGAFAQSNHTGNSTHDTDGWYSDDLDSTDTNTVGILLLQIVVAGALPVWHEYTVVPADVYDTLIAGTDAMPSQVEGMDANVLTASALATDAVNEIRDAVTGGAFSLDTDANGRVRVVDGTGAGEIDTASGRVQITEAQIDQVVDEIWDEAVSGHVTAGTTGERVERLDIIASGGSGGLTNARAVNLDNLDATVSSRATPAQVNTEVDTALADVNLDHVAGTAAPGNPPAGTYLDILADDGTATYDRTTDSLQAIRDRGDAAWTTADISTLTAAIGTVADAAAAGDPTAVDTLVAYVKQIINTLEGTVGIPVFPAEAAPANNVSLAEVIRAIHSDVTGLNGSAMRGTDNAALASTIGTPVGADISADIAAVQSDTDDIQTRLPASLVGGRMDSNVGAISGNASAADKAEEGYRAVVTFTIGVGSSTTALVLSSSNPSFTVNDQPNGKIITFREDTTTAALRGQSTDITDYVQSTNTLTVTALTTAPVSGDVGVIT